jgi:hypothetical protein
MSASRPSSYCPWLNPYPLAETDREQQRPGAFDLLGCCRLAFVGCARTCTLGVRFPSACEALESSRGRSHSSGTQPPALPEREGQDLAKPIGYMRGSLNCPGVKGRVGLPKLKQADERSVHGCLFLSMLGTPVPIRAEKSVMGSRQLERSPKTPSFPRWQPSRIHQRARLCVCLCLGPPTFAQPSTKRLDSWTSGHFPCSHRCLRPAQSWIRIGSALSRGLETTIRKAISRRSARFAARR